ncbi:hypothetical protein ABZ412_15990 [Nocardia sp. NPDC005746]|uniref:hypothetical protein n=1 Tax=Nocardia sp. NPDC005746 TaxID=3157062 RepID=UPI0033E756C4
MRTKLIGVIVAGLAVGVVGGCSKSESAPAGMFDPCKEIRKSAIRSAGYDPESKKDVPTIGDYSVKCRFTSYSGHESLYLEHPSAAAPIRSYEGYLASAQSAVNSPGGQAPTVTKINGRDAYVGPQTILGCTVILRTATAVMSVEVSYADGNTCVSAQNAATVFEPAIGTR